MIRNRPATGNREAVEWVIGRIAIIQASIVVAFHDRRAEFAVLHVKRVRIDVRRGEVEAVAHSFSQRGLQGVVISVVTIRVPMDLAEPRIGVVVGFAQLLVKGSSARPVRNAWQRLVDIRKLEQPGGVVPYIGDIREMLFPKECWISAFQ